MSSKNNPLGKDLKNMGIYELLSTINRPEDGSSTTTAVKEGDTSRTQSVAEISLASIVPSPYQARRVFDEQSLQQLVQSIKTHGIIQPVVLRQISQHQYELVAGERRWRAAQQADLDTIPAVVKVIDNQTSMILGLVENLQRDSIDVVDQAEGYQRLTNEFQLSHDHIALLVGRSRSAITNLIRLCQLDDNIKKHLRKGDIEMGHARALLALDPSQRLRFVDRAIRENWTVRQIEEAIRLHQGSKPANPKSSAKSGVTRQYQAWTDKISRRWNHKVQIKPGSQGRGKLVFHYQSDEDLKDLLEQLSPAPSTDK